VKNVKNMIAEIFEEMANGLQSGSFGTKVRVGITIEGSEHGPEEMLRGAELAQQTDPSLEVVVIGRPDEATSLSVVESDCLEDSHKIMDRMFLAGELDAGVTMHYAFPIGVSTVGRVVTPGLGRKMYIANTTGTTDTERVSAMLKNTVSAIAAAKACGNPAPTVGILNIDGGRQLERMLMKLRDNGYPIRFTSSARADGGVVMRGNDLLQGVPDIMVMDSLTGNVIIKMLSAFTTGGSYESLGDGYGPGVGPGYDRIINIISRASGAPVVAGGIHYAGQCAKGRLLDKVEEEYKLAGKAGLMAILENLSAPVKGTAKEVEAPPEKVVTSDIPGIEIMEIEDAVRALWRKGVYASSGMGCTGPIVLVAPEDTEQALAILKSAGYL